LLPEHGRKLTQAVALAGHIAATRLSPENGSKQRPIVDCDLQRFRDMPSA